MEAAVSGYDSPRHGVRRRREGGDPELGSAQSAQHDALRRRLVGPLRCRSPPAAPLPADPARQGQRVQVAAAIWPASAKKRAASGPPASTGASPSRRWPMSPGWLRMKSTAITATNSEIPATICQPTRQSHDSRTSPAAGDHRKPTIAAPVRMIAVARARYLRNQYTGIAWAGSSVEKPIPMPPTSE